MRHEPRQLGHDFPDHQRHMRDLGSVEESEGGVIYTV
jgi:hypothetical protein